MEAWALVAMQTWYYEVVSIDGDYVNLKRTDIESDDLKLVARDGADYKACPSVSISFTDGFG